MSRTERRISIEFKNNWRVGERLEVAEAGATDCAQAYEQEEFANEELRLDGMIEQRIRNSPRLAQKHIRSPHRG